MHTVEVYSDSMHGTPIDKKTLKTFKDVREYVATLPPDTPADNIVFDGGVIYGFDELGM